MSELASIEVDGKSGTDTIDVESTGVGIAVTVNLGSGTDTVRVCPWANNMSTLASNVQVNAARETTH